MNSDAITPIVSAEIFMAVQAERTRRQKRYGKDELLQLLKECHERHGKVTAPIIAADPAMPDPQLLVRSFGSLIKAYEAAGLPRTRSYAFVETKRILASMREQLLAEVIGLAAGAGATVDRTPTPFVITLNGALAVKVDVAPPRTPRRGLRNWRIAPDDSADFQIVGRFAPSSKKIHDFFLVSAAELADGPLYVKDSNLSSHLGNRFSTLEEIFGFVD